MTENSELNDCLEWTGYGLLEVIIAAAVLALYIEPLKTVADLKTLVGFMGGLTGIASLLFLISQKTQPKQKVHALGINKD